MTASCWLLFNSLIKSTLNKFLIDDNDWLFPVAKLKINLQPHKIPGIFSNIARIIVKVCGHVSVVKLFCMLWLRNKCWSYAVCIVAVFRIPGRTWIFPADSDRRGGSELFFWLSGRTAVCYPSDSGWSCSGRSGEFCAGRRSLGIRLDLRGFPSGRCSVWGFYPLGRPFARERTLYFYCPKGRGEYGSGTVLCVLWFYGF